MTAFITLDEARIAIRDNAQKVARRILLLGRPARANDMGDLRASGIAEAIEKAAVALAAYYAQQVAMAAGDASFRAPAGSHRLVSVLDADMLGFRC